MGTRWVAGVRRGSEMKTRESARDPGRIASADARGPRGPISGEEEKREGFDAGRSGLHSLTARLTEDRVDAFHQLPRTERLRDVVVRAHFESHLLVHVATLRGEKDDRDVAG